MILYAELNPRVRTEKVKGDEPKISSKMDYSDRVNSKKGAGGLADQQEANVHRRKRVKELLTESILNLDNDPYVFKNHLGILECKLCLTTHVNETSYLSHIGGKKHQLNLEKRRLLDEKSQKVPKNLKNIVSISNIPKRKWTKIGKPQYKVTKIRDVTNYQMGLLVNVKYPKIVLEIEPLFRFQNYYELSPKNQNMIVSYIDHNYPEDKDHDLETYQYLVISAEPYENICLIIPGDKQIDRIGDKMSDTYWWYWDKDIKEFYLQFLYKE